MRVSFAIMTVLLVACGGNNVVDGVNCKADADCKITGATGKCESTGFCSFPDATCAGGSRYSPGAGNSLGDTCVGGPAACGAMSQACCNDSVCGSDLVCASGTCQCGGDEQPCCGGTVCSTNLTCGTGGTCECGGASEPCCGGTMCGTGLTCGGGTCSAGVSQVALGKGHVCALLSDQTVSCWGTDNKYGYGTPGLGIATIANAKPALIQGTQGAVEIHAGEYHTCARKADGTLWCWGHNESGQLGDNTTTSRTSAVQVQGLSGVTKFATGRMHTCALGTVGGTTSLYCWGRGGSSGRRPGTTAVTTFTRLGNSDVAAADAKVPAAVDLSVAGAGGATVKTFAAGGYHTCAIMTNNTVWCWGRNNNGQLGNNTTTSSIAPVQVDLSQITIPLAVTIDELSLNTDSTASTCMRLSDNTVYCWGSNNYGMNAGTAGNRPTVALNTTPLAGATLTALAAGLETRCGIASTGTVWCWGRNQGGALGADVNLTGFRDNNTNSTPIQALNLTNVTQLAVGHHTACAIDNTASLYCWGNNRRGQVTARPPTSDAESRQFHPVRVQL